MVLFFPHRVGQGGNHNSRKAQLIIVEFLAHLLADGGGHVDRHDIITDLRRA